MNADLERRIAAIASDRESGASRILAAVVAMLRDAFDEGEDMLTVARSLCRAQPSMASVWNAAIAALRSEHDRSTFDAFAQHVARAPAALLRFAAGCFRLPPDAESGSTPLSIVTISFSHSVSAVLEQLARSRPLRVACCESRPALEGRRLATDLAAMGVPVMLFTDAAIAHALGDADAVLVGADAVAPEWFLNKSGTRLLAAAAGQQGIPVFVVASRDKFVNDRLAGLLQPREGAPDEVWDAAPAGVQVRNPYFESTPLDLVSSVITDVGILGAGMVPEACISFSPDLSTRLIDRLRSPK